jgi:signal transduction histidine kinase
MQDLGARSLLARVRSLLTGWAACLALCTAIPAQGATLTIDAARAVVSVEGVTTSADVRLPYHWDRVQRTHPGTALLRMQFDLPEPSFHDVGEPYALYFAHIGNAADIFINGTLLAQLGEVSVPNADDFAKSPQYVSIPPQLLQHTNVLTLRLRADAGRRAGVSTILVGPARQVLPHYKRDFTLRYAVSLGVTAISILVGALALALWLTQVDPGHVLEPRRDALYLCAGVAELCWALRVGDVAIEHPPLDWPAWGIVVTAAFSGWICCIALFCHHVAGWHRHPSMPWFRRSMGALFLTSIVAAWLSLQQHQPAYLTAWLGFANLFFVVYAGFYLWAAWRAGDSARLLLALAGTLNVIVGVRDWITIRISGDLAEITWIRYSSVLFGLVLGYIAISRFRAASAQARDLWATLESRVQQKESELQNSYEKLEALAREQARTSERSRILRDMHDGVGSHISAAIRQLQSGRASSDEVLATLRGSLDQLKLSIDAMNLPPGDITALLANLRYRLEPRFAASDVELQWDVDDLAPLERLDAGAMRQLQFMVFEALSNVLQHAQARVLRIEAHAVDDGVALRIIDDGRGFDTNRPPRKGLQSMHERAGAIGARVVLQSAPGRTVIEIRLPGH